MQFAIKTAKEKSTHGTVQVLHPDTIRCKQLHKILLLINAFDFTAFIIHNIEQNDWSSIPLVRIIHMAEEYLLSNLHTDKNNNSQPRKMTKSSSCLSD